MQAIRKILVPIDFSDPSQSALEDAIDLAKTWGSELHLLHCYSIHPAAMDPYGLAYPERFEQEVRQAAQSRLSEWGEKARAQGVEVTEHLSGRFPSDEIPAQAAELGIDLIVMGTRGLSGLKHVLLGSVAERSLRAAPCPVWVSRSS